MTCHGLQGGLEARILKDGAGIVLGGIPDLSRLAPSAREDPRGLLACLGELLLGVIAELSDPFVQQPRWWK